jgi:hypothetical protein
MPGPSVANASHASAGRAEDAEGGQGPRTGMGSERDQDRRSPDPTGPHRSTPVGARSARPRPSGPPDRCGLMTFAMAARIRIPVDGRTRSPDGPTRSRAREVAPCGAIR